MVTLSGIGSLANTTLGRTVEGRERRKSTLDTSAPTADDVAISGEAQQAADVQRLMLLASQQGSDIRQERVDQARERINQGAFRLQEVVLQVASRVSAYV